MTSTTATTSTSKPPPAERFPLAALAVMALTGFVLLATETMPAGLLPQIADGMNTSEAGSPRVWWRH